MPSGNLAYSGRLGKAPLRKTSSKPKKGEKALWEGNQAEALAEAVWREEREEDPCRPVCAAGNGAGKSGGPGIELGLQSKKWQPQIFVSQGNSDCCM